jgi:hypothetical protein
MRRWIIILAGIVVLLAAAIWVLEANRSSAPMPTYQGKTAQYWLGEIFTTNQTTALQAFRAMGTNAAPMLLKAISARDSFWMKSYSTLCRLLPVSVRRRTRRISAQDGQNAAQLVIINDPNMRAILPDLVQLLSTSKDNRGRIYIVGCVCSLMTDKDTYCLPMLTDCLKDTNALVQYQAIGALERLGESAKPALPQLVTIMNDSNVLSAGLIIPGWDAGLEIRLRAAHSVWKISNDTTGPEIVYHEGLASTNSHAQAYSAIYLSEMLPEDLSAMPKIEQLLQSSDQAEEMIAASMVGRYGPAARDAVPALRNMISGASDANLRAAALRSLKKIDPAAAAEYEKR